MFQPKCKGITYKGHFTPCGATVVPKGTDGVRHRMDSWQIWQLYILHMLLDLQLQHGTWSLRKGLASLILQNWRRTRSTMILLARLFTSTISCRQFMIPPNLVLSKTTAAECPSILVWLCTNLYRMWKGLGTEHSHRFQSETEIEMLKWAGAVAVVRHGARSGRPMGLHYFWLP